MEFLDSRKDEFRPRSEDFPALSSAGPKSSGSSSSLYSSLSRAPQRFSEPPSDSRPTSRDDPTASIKATEVRKMSNPSGVISLPEPDPSHYTLKGLLKIIRMTDQDLVTLALGTDLTTLGLDLNSTE